MTYHHFTAAHFLPEIRRRGLTKGAIPWNYDRNGRPTMQRGYQWLTTNPDFNQPWCLLGDLPYARNAVRLTIAIPATHQPKLAKWLELCARYRPHCADDVNAVGGDVENWRVYHGRIPPGWIVAEEINFGERLRPQTPNLG